MHTINISNMGVELLIYAQEQLLSKCLMVQVKDTTKKLLK